LINRQTTVIISPIFIALEKVNYTPVVSSGCIYVTWNSRPTKGDEARVITCYAIWNQLPVVLSYVQTKTE
jgi:hypothetical protein